MVVHIQLLAQPAIYMLPTNITISFCLLRSVNCLLALMKKMPFLRDLLLPLLLLHLPLLLYALVKSYYRAKKWRI